MDYIELFAGIGGFRVGLETVGGRELQGLPAQPSHGEHLTRSDFTCVWSNEWDKYARAVYRYHFGDIDGRDITTIPIGDIPDADLIVGGPPCQDFSVAGARAGIEGDRGNLMLTTIGIIQAKRPRYFLLENVPGLLSSGGGRDFAYIIDALWQDGLYSTQWTVCNSSHFGVPQNRERVFIVGSLRGEPRPEILPVGSSDENDREGGDEPGPGLWAVGVDAHYGHGPDGKRTMIQVGNIYGDYNPTEGRVYDPQGLCPNLATPTGGNQMPLISGSRIRRLTPLETERLQGFPDNWTARGIDDNGNEVAISDTQRYKMTGNAVTTNVIAHFARALAKRGDTNVGV